MGGSEQRPGGPAEPGDLSQHPRVPGPADRWAPGEQPESAAAPGVFQAAAIAAHGHAHVGGLRAHAQLGEEPRQEGIGALVVDDEAGREALRGG